VANPYRNEIEVTLNGTKYLLRPTFDCLAIIEDQLNQSIYQIMIETGSGKLKVKDAYFILETAIKAAGGTVVKADLQRDLGEGGLNQMLKAITDFLVTATQAGDNVKKN
jgi:hypothetical protein